LLKRRDLRDEGQDDHASRGQQMRTTATVGTDGVFGAIEITSHSPALECPAITAIRG
jgi:hypothetical protein